MGIYEEWKKEVEERLSTFSKEKIPAIIKRCPKCFSLALEFDVKAGKVKCTKCDFEENITRG